MVKCANCNTTVEYDGEIIRRIENENYEEVIDKGYCYDVKCDNCDYINSVQVLIETVTTVVQVDVQQMCYKNISIVSNKQRLSKRVVFFYALK